MDLERRLENWARANRLGTGRPGYCAPWAKLADAIANGGQGGGLSDVDEADAAAVEMAWRRLQSHHKQLLKLSYVTNMPPWIVCRRLGIKQRPTSVFDLEMARAKHMLRQHLQVVDEDTIARRSVRRYTPPDNLIPA